MRKIKETLRLVHELGLSQRQTAQAIRVPRSTVQDCLVMPHLHLEFPRTRVIDIG